MSGSTVSICDVCRASLSACCSLPSCCVSRRRFPQSSSDTFPLCKQDKPNRFEPRQKPSARQALSGLNRNKSIALPLPPLFASLFQNNQARIQLVIIQAALSVYWLTVCLEKCNVNVWLEFGVAVKLERTEMVSCWNKGVLSAGLAGVRLVKLSGIQEGLANSLTA